jgi:hypothetical protein
MKDKSCGNCRYGGMDDCYKIIGDCLDYDKWEPIIEAKPLSNFHVLANSIANIVVEKQAAYGDSVGSSKEFLKLLYPVGIPVGKYDDMLMLIRIFDKLKRIVTDKDAFGESPFSDIMGYCLLALNMREKQQMLKDE